MVNFQLLSVKWRNENYFIPIINVGAMGQLTPNENEKLVLWGLVRYPNHVDRKLADAIGIKMSTVTAIRNRLAGKRLFSTVRAPNMQRIGCELMWIGLISLDPRASAEVGSKLKKAVAPIGGIVYALADQMHLVCFAYARSYSEAKDEQGELQSRLLEAGITQEEGSPLRSFIFPLANSRPGNFFDFSALLASLFGFHRKDAISPGLPSIGPDYRPLKLSRIERKVFAGLIKNPTAMDIGTAKKIGVTRQSTTKIRRRLQSDGFVFRFRAPIIGSLGFDILALEHVAFSDNPAGRETKKAKSKAGGLDPSLIFDISDARERLALRLTCGFQDANDSPNIRQWYDEYGDRIEAEPERILFSLAGLQVVKDFDFIEVTERILKTNAERPGPATSRP